MKILPQQGTREWYIARAEQTVRHIDRAIKVLVDDLGAYTDKDTNAAPYHPAYQLLQTARESLENALRKEGLRHA